MPGRPSTPRVLAVTGAAQGIGEACAAAAAADARVLVIDVDGAGAAATAARLVDGGADAVAATADVRSVAELTAAIEAGAARFGPVDAVIHCAGGMAGTAAAPLLDLDPGDLARVLELNVGGTVAVLQAAARHMIAAGHPGGPSAGPGTNGAGPRPDRSIVVVASLQGLLGAPRLAAYGASKAGMIHLVRTAALELAPHGIRVNAVSPTITDSPSVRRMVDDERRRASEQTIPLGRIGEGADVAAAALLLASPGGSFITGQNLVVDGGLSLTTARPARR